MLCTCMFDGLSLAFGRIVNFGVCLHSLLPLECVFVRDGSFSGTFHYVLRLFLVFDE